MNRDTIAKMAGIDPGRTKRSYQPAMSPANHCEWSVQVPFQLTLDDLGSLLHMARRDGVPDTAAVVVSNVGVRCIWQEPA